MLGGAQHFRASARKEIVMMRSTIAVLAAFFALLGFTATASAQMVCGKHTEIANKLTDGYQEHQTSAGIARNGSLVEVFSSKKGTWTILYTVPGGQTCLMAVGDNWQVLKQPMKVTGQSY
jgi:hypothetical protein